MAEDASVAYEDPQPNFGSVATPDKQLAESNRSGHAVDSHSIRHSKNEIRDAMGVPRDLSRADGAGRARKQREGFSGHRSPRRKERARRFEGKGRGTQY
jgi:hypothetical protein